MEDFYRYFIFNDTHHLTTSVSRTTTHNKHSDLKAYTSPNHTPTTAFPTIPLKVRVIAWIVICIGFPLTLLAIYRLYSMVKNNHVAPVYVINLLISDLIQICCFVIWVTKPRSLKIIKVSNYIYFSSMLVSVGFMVCVALERYLVVACPLWYHSKRSIKFSLLVSVIVWVLCFIEFLVVYLIRTYMLMFHSIFLLLPFPVLIFCLAGTLKSLSSAISVTPEEKRRIIGALVLVLLNYTLLFLPWIIWLVSHRHTHHIFSSSAISLLQFSSLVDLILYVFMTKGTVDKLLALCCCRLTGQEEQSQVTTINEITTENISSV